MDLPPFSRALTSFGVVNMTAGIRGDPRFCEENIHTRTCFKLSSLKLSLGGWRIGHLKPSEAGARGRGDQHRPNTKPQTRDVLDLEQFSYVALSS